MHEGRLLRTGEPVVVKVARGATAQTSLLSEYHILKLIAQSHPDGHPNIVKVSFCFPFYLYVIHIRNYYYIVSIRFSVISNSFSHTT